ncbi:MAG: large repetitive protein, partial [Thermoanaerobaculia bacterium]|nr:large repetitive protein [Thermoanaerobaculia bacterium]
MRIVAAVLLISVCLPLGAQTPYLVKDINTTTNSVAASSSPANFIRFGSRIYFSATTAANGTELWSTDGTQSGTTLVADPDHGPLSGKPSRLVVVNGRLVFNAVEVGGQELWATDGTAAGTRLLADIAPGSTSSLPGDRIVYHGQLIFAANDGVSGNELWITDGTPAGTRFLKDLAPGATGSNPRGFVVFNDSVYFAADDGLWKTDATANGTIRVKDAVAVNSLTVTAFGLFFSGYTASDGVQPWVSDGTENGTRRIGTPGAGNIETQSYATAFGDRVLFVGFDAAHGDELWISDGTAAGTHMLHDVNAGVNPAITTNPFIAVAGGVAFFSAIDGARSELWKTDGTEAGTTMVRDIGGFGSLPSGIIALGSNVYFRAATTPNGATTLWTSDGTAAGTRQINASHPIGVSSPNTSFILGSTFTLPTFTAIDGSLYFAGSNSLNGVEPWKSDGTDAGTVMIANLINDPVPSSSPQKIVAAGDWVYFEAWDGTGEITQEGLPWSLRRSDGTPEGTMKMADLPRPPYVPVGRSLLFNKGGIWISDGTPEGTGPVTELSTHFRDPSFTFYASGNIVINQMGGEFWATTTTPGATAVRIGGSPFTTTIVNVAGRLLLIGGGVISTTDGTADGTYAIVPNLGEVADLGTAVAGGYVFFGTHGTTTGKLWKTDGTFDGTVVVKALPGGTTLMSAAGRNVYFTTSGGQLWVTDGTDAGTHSLPATPAQGPLAAIGDSVVFAATDANAGTELWVSDGTSAGTHLVADLYPGTFSSAPTQLTTAAGLVYFRASHDLFGSEPWVTDGTAAGTKLVADIEPGLAGSAPQDFVQAGDRLFFDATTSSTGAELWALPLTNTRLTIDGVRVTEGDSGTATAHFTVRLSPAASKVVTVDYATADGTATSGSDYTAAAGTLTFAPGETSRSVDVTVRGDMAAENNETFFMTLKNAAGATLVKPSAFAIIDDDDQSADVGLSLAFGSQLAAINATNSGPRAATNFKYATTSTPGNASSGSLNLLQLPSGTTAQALIAQWSFEQQYFTATVTARERDPVLANNTIAWTARGDLAMDALYLTPGSQANVSFSFGITGQYSIESSNAAVVSVPSSTTVPAPGAVTTFVARALSSGSATIRVLSPTQVIATMAIDVVPAGTTPRWPGAINVSVDRSSLSFGTQAIVTIENHGTAPYTAVTATGLVTISAKGRELGRMTLGAKSQQFTVPVFPVDIGPQQIDVTYAGDANFLPSTSSFPMTVTRGGTTIVAFAQRKGADANVHVRITGLPIATPQGTINVSEHGTHQTPASL